MALSTDQPDRRRAHVERMLLRAERRSRQAAKLVEKWKARLADLDRQGVAAKQAKLWTDDVVSRGE
jgi:F0F1-type ATP synthase membrane subunit b/b'